MSVDASEVYALARDFEAVGEILPAKMRQAIQQTAIKSKKAWQGDAKGKAGPRTKGYPGSIDYTIKSSSGVLSSFSSASGGGAVEAEIGPNLSRYGGKGSGLIPSMGILEESGVAGGGRGSIAVAFKFAETDFDKGLQIAVDQTMKARNL